MRYIIMSVEKFTYKDKVTHLSVNAVVVYGLAPNCSVIKPFFYLEGYQKFPFDKFVLDKSDVENLHKDYKSCDIQFDPFGRIVSVTE